MPSKILFLCARLQPFLIAGINELLAAQPDAEVLVYCAQSDTYASLDIRTDARFRIFTYAYEPEPFFWKDAVGFKPDLVFVAGWMYRQYVEWAGLFKKNGARTICAMDTQYKGTLKQRAFIAFGSKYVRQKFTHAWVPGVRAKEYALRLGFAEDTISENLYAADTALFSSVPLPENGPARRFLYVGRLEPHKVSGLLQAFSGLTKEQRNGYVLDLIGEGSISPQAYKNDADIRFLPWASQRVLAAECTRGGVFCLTSADEPWGTVIQEFAAGGFPLIVSKQCGAGDAFLKDNGFLCDGTDVRSIQNALLNCIASSPETLREMSLRSCALGSSVNSKTWAATLLSFLA